MRPSFFLLAVALTSIQLHAQWDIEESHTTASLRGVHNVGGGVAWASGTNGTVLRTEDGGYLWQTCAIPPGAEKLDFRAIQGFDEKTAIAMSIGKGDQSRLYKTTDGCQTWTLLTTNTAPDGFWDSLKLWSPTKGFLAGDQVDGNVTLLETSSGDHFESVSPMKALPHEGAFAASNSSLSLGPRQTRDGAPHEVWFATGGPSGSRIIHYQSFKRGDPGHSNVTIVSAPSFPKSDSAGIFSIFMENGSNKGIAVGGDYLKPNDTTGTASYTLDKGKTWIASQTLPHGFRSAVAYDAKQRLWITVGPNGTDISSDDGKNWHPLATAPTDPADADENWNALSLPFVVGPHGRIGRLRTVVKK
jgi:photosystem II stability/assembly factor-like uncharacterized protein